MKFAFLAFVVLIALVSASLGQAPKALPPGTERGEAEILKVYSVDDQGAKFRAYEIKYKGHDVIVSDDLARTDYKVGEKLDFLAMRINNTLQLKVFGFGVVPKKK